MTNRFDGAFEGAKGSARARAERAWKGVREMVTDSGDPPVVESHAGTLPGAAPAAPGTLRRGTPLRREMYVHPDHT